MTSGWERDHYRLDLMAIGVEGAVVLLKSLAGPAHLFQAEISISADKAAGWKRRVETSNPTPLV